MTECVSHEESVLLSWFNLFTIFFLSTVKAHTDPRKMTPPMFHLVFSDTTQSWFFSFFLGGGVKIQFLRALLQLYRALIHFNRALIHLKLVINQTK